MKKSKQLERIKTQLKESPKTLKPDKAYFNKMAAICITNDIHIDTIHKLQKIKNIDQMLETMYETTVKEYNLHEPTIKRLKEDASIRKLLETKSGRKIQV